MINMTCRSISIDVDVDFDQFDDRDLIDELKSRGYAVNSESSAFKIVEELHQLRRTGKDYNQVIDHLIYTAIGKIV